MLHGQSWSTHHVSVSWISASPKTGDI